MEVSGRVGEEKWRMVEEEGRERRKESGDKEDGGRVVERGRVEERKRRKGEGGEEEGRREAEGRRGKRRGERRSAEAGGRPRERKRGETESGKTTMVDIVVMESRQKREKSCLLYTSPSPRD